MVCDVVNFKCDEIKVVGWPVSWNWRIWGWAWVRLKINQAEAEAEVKLGCLEVRLLSEELMLVAWLQDQP